GNDWPRRVTMVGMTHPDTPYADGDYELEERQALRRVVGLSTELEDITEVEYRQLRLERVVLVGVWTAGTLTEAENSLVDLARRPGCQSPRPARCSTVSPSVATAPIRPPTSGRARPRSCARSSPATAPTR